MFKSASTVFLSQLATTIGLFARNIIVARLISVEDFGIASTFAIMFAMVEASTNVGLDRMIVQDKDGDDPNFLKVLHLVQLLRGVLGGCVMLIVAYPFARIMHTPDIIWAYQLLALLPVLRGLLHLDMFRFQRDMRFMPFAIVSAASPYISLLVAIAVYFVSPDYQTMLWAILAHQAVQVVMSHIWAEQPYKIGWDRTIFNRAMSFGIPLLLNGMAIFIILNGDRMIVANQLGLEVLGWFSAAYMLAYTPCLMLAKTLNSVMLPQLSRRRSDPTAFNATALAVCEAGLFLSALVAVGLAVAGPVMVLLVFGERYIAALSVIGLLGIMHAMRISKMGPATAAVASGMTKLPLYANMLRLIALPIGYWALTQGHGLTVLILIALVGEALGFMLLVFMVGRKVKLPIRRLALPVAGYATLMIAVLLDIHLATPQPGLWGSLHMAQIALIAMLLGFLFCLPQLRRLVRERLKKS